MALERRPGEEARVRAQEELRRVAPHELRELRLVEQARADEAPGGRQDAVEVAGVPVAEVGGEDRAQPRAGGDRRGEGEGDRAVVGLAAEVEAVREERGELLLAAGADVAPVVAVGGRLPGCGERREPRAQVAAARAREEV